MVVVRMAELPDAAVMGSVHVRAWQAAYPGLMPQAYLDGLVVAEWVDGWRAGLSRPHESDPVLVATFGPDRDGNSGGELYALNVDPDDWGSGVGTALLAASHEGLAGLGHTSANLWVVPGNQRARRFYNHHGWTATADERTEDILGVTVPELRYERSLP